MRKNSANSRGYILSSQNNNSSSISSRGGQLGANGGMKFSSIKDLLRFNYKNSKLSSNDSDSTYQKID